MSSSSVNPLAALKNSGILKVETLNDIKGLNVRAGVAVMCLGLNAVADGRPLFGHIVDGTGGAQNDGFVVLDNGNQQFECVTGKFCYGRSSVGKNFSSLYNWVDNIEISRMSDGTSSGDSHIYGLPLEVRRNSHAFMLSNGTREGSSDIVARTSGYSDFCYFNFTGGFGNENFSVLVDTLPARADGAKKNASDGGYSFDSALTIPSNRTFDVSDLGSYVSFPAFGVLSGNSAWMRRGLGSKLFSMSHVDSNSFALSAYNVNGELLESPNELIKYNHESIEISNKLYPCRFFDWVTKPLCSGDFSLDYYLMATVDGDSSIAAKLLVSNVKKIVKIKCNAFGSGGGQWIYEHEFFADGVGGISTIGAITDTTPAQVVIAPSVDVDGDVIMSVSYSSGYGADLRLRAKIEVI